MRTSLAEASKSQADAVPAAPPPRGPSWRRWFDRVSLAGGLALLVWVVSRYPLADLRHACATMGLPVLLTLVVALGWHACNSVGMGVLVGWRVRWRTLLWLRLAAEGYNSLIIGIGGEPFRIRTLSRYLPSDEVVAVVIRDKVLDHATGYLVSAIFITWGVSHYPLAAGMRASLGTYAMIVVVASIASTAVVATRLPGRVGGWLVKIFGGVTSAPAPIPPALLLRSLPWYFAGRVLGVVEIALLLRLLRVASDPMRAGFIDGVLNAAGTLGFMVPQSIGVFEGTSAYLFKLFGFAGSLGVVFALVRRARMLAMSLFGVALHWLGRDWRDSPRP